MNREILFRGQTRKRGEKVNMAGEPIDGNWVYGGIFQGSDDFSIIYGSSEPDNITADNLAKYVVYTDTVGQYTGLTDTKKHKAFGDDIVCYKGTHTVYGIIRYGEIHDREGRLNHIGYYIEWQNDGANMWGDWWRSDLGYWLTEPNCEICSNVHDNPELIGGEDDDKAGESDTGV